MNIIYCWSHISGYMTSCWRALANDSDHRVTILALEPDDSSNVRFDRELLHGLDAIFLTPKDATDPSKIWALLAVRAPDILVISGWWNAGYVKVAEQCAVRGIKVVMAMDNPGKSTPRTILRRLRSQVLFKRLDAVIVPGERGMQFAQSLGIDRFKVFTGLYGTDQTLLRSAVAIREANDWPRTFLHLGQLTRIKGFDLLLAGYSVYRTIVPDPWTFTVCGLGPLSSSIEGTSGVRYRGFVSPAELVPLFASQGAFVLLSRFDPWPLALVEASASGLPIISSQACGSAVELLRDHYNGRVVRDTSPEGVAGSLKWMHDNVENCAVMGQRSAELAAAYSVAMWVSRWNAMFSSLIGD